MWRTSVPCLPAEDTLRRVKERSSPVQAGLTWLIAFCTFVHFQHHHGTLQKEIVISGNLRQNHPSEREEGKEGVAASQRPRKHANFVQNGGAR